MRRLRLLLAGLVTMVISALPTLAADTVKVVRVTGVDSFVTEDGTAIGLLGITSPDGKGATADECRAHLASLIEGKEVILITDTTVADIPGRSPQRLVYLDGNLINLQMIADGYARPSSTHHQRSDSFASANTTARANGLGAYTPRHSTTTESSSGSSERSTSVQCSGTTKKGSRCKRMTTNASGRCWQHGG